MARGGVSYNAFRCPAKSQNFIRQLPASGAPSIDYPLDGFPLPSLLYSYRTMRTGWVGREMCAIRVNGAGTYGSGANLNGEYIVRDSSLIGITGASECTCYSGGDAGNIRTLTQLLTQGGNNSIFVGSIFDQTGALPSRELGQTVAANQPALTSSAGVLNTFGTSGRTSHLGNNTSGLGVPSLAASVLCDTTTAATTAVWIVDTAQVGQNTFSWEVAASNRYALHDTWADLNVYCDLGDTFPGAGGGRMIAVGVLGPHQGSYQRSSLAVGNLYRGATLIQGRTDMGQVISGTTSFVLGNVAALNQGQQGSQPEFVIWNTDQYANITGFLSTQRTYYAV